ncbi:autotransporter outer membrane beta-barrel domain-containing protein [Pseudomonas koreensis]|uniref:autotransporter outer membrane beta-barrel domain-containing protein n=1 Tax=Pseudomonas koreensis TaxID=198620 RepID=UPI000695BA49|nr:autotransporter outer membrane beta-barrel domain-containing protein [Pseudomonas koreensis]NTZ95479.1 autotransporter outer membrane beta-barrel domain-containing protein [Pseudomonas koreensis]
MKALSVWFNGPVVKSTLGAFIFIPAFSFFGSGVQAAVIVNNTSLDIDATTAPIDYLVRNRGVLNVNGATTQSITVQSGSTLNINGATVASNPGVEGILVTSSRGTINQATVTSDDIGLAVNRSSIAAGGSTVDVSNSQIRGDVFGAQVTGLSTLSLVNTQVTGTGSNGIGANLLGGALNASAGSVISGQATGVRIVNDTDNVGARSLSLDNATVQGINGSAVLVDRGTDATINLSNGASLLAGNNNLLDVQGASTATMTVANSNLQGNINIAGNSTGNLTFDQGRMTGDVLVENGSTANVTLQNSSQFTGRLDKVDGVTVNSGSIWTLTGNDTVGTLAMSGGTVRFGAQDVPNTFYQLNVGTLAGSPDGSSTFAMKGNFATGQHDLLNVTGVATGSFGLLVAASGLDAVNPQQLTLVRTAAGDAQFALTGGRVDLGTWSYDLAQRQGGTGGTEWFLDPTTQVISPGASAVLALFNSPITLLYGEASSLRSRMGELRFNGGQSGAWVRTYGNQYNVSESSGVAYKQNQQGLSLGADARLNDSDVLGGVMVGFSESDLSLEHGTSGTVKSYYFGPYVTWMDRDTGYYVDGVLKFNRFRNEAKVGLSDGTRAKGDYDNWGVSASVEGGRHIKLSNDYFIEPFVQFSAAQIQGKRFSLDNDMQAEGDRTRSFLGKAGATAGRNFDIGNGAVAQPYVRAAIAHEFAKNNEVQVNNNVFNNDLSGSRAEFGAGVAVAMSDKWQVHVDLDYANGEHIEQPWGGNVGVRYSW